MAKKKKHNSSNRSNSASASKSKPAPRSPKTKSKSATAVSSNRRPGWSNEQIGEIAGAVWQVLTDKGGQSLATLRSSINAPPELVLAAVGWLAREDKLQFETSGRAVKVLLRP